MEIQQPIFVIGTGRCGSTIFQQMICEHPHLAWLSALGDMVPKRTAWHGRLMRAVDWPVVGSTLRRQKPFRPWEPYGIWEVCSPGFSEPCRDLTAHDVTHHVKKRTRKILSTVLTKKRQRLLVKITGWPRIGFLQEIFPDAKFIHILRDGRAVVNSLLKVSWWSGWRGPQNWRWGELTPEQYAVWQKHDFSFAALGGIEWNILMDAMAAAKQQVSSGSLLEIKYEALCAEPQSTFRTIAEFCNLEFTAPFENALKTYTLKNTNDHRLNDLTEDQEAVLTRVMHPYLSQFGYL